MTNPEVSSVRDSDRILGILSSKTRKAEQGEGDIIDWLAYFPNLSVVSRCAPYDKTADLVTAGQ